MRLWKWITSKKPVAVPPPPSPVKDEKLVMTEAEADRWLDLGNKIRSWAILIIASHPHSDKEQDRYRDGRVSIERTYPQEGFGYTAQVTVSLMRMETELVKVFDSLYNINRFNEGEWVEYIRQLALVAREHEARKAKLLWEPISDSDIFRKPV